MKESVPGIELDDDGATVVASQQALLDDEVRGDPQRWRPLIHDDFVQVGFGGSEVDKEGLADHFRPLNGRVDFEEVSCDRLSKDVILLRWRGASPQGVVNRGSVWVRTPDGWQLRFQQGTVQPGTEG